MVESTATGFSEIPDGATILFKKNMYRGQPLVKQHAAADELWDACVKTIAMVIWYLTGAEEGEFRTAQDGYDKFNRCVTIGGLLGLVRLAHQLSMLSCVLKLSQSCSHLSTDTTW